MSGRVQRLASTTLKPYLSHTSTINPQWPGAGRIQSPAFLDVSCHRVPHVSKHKSTLTFEQHVLFPMR